MSEYAFKGKDNPKIISPIDPDYVLKFKLSKKDLGDYEDFSSFVNSVKMMVRKDARYTNYKAYLYDIGLTRCQVFSGITNEMAPLEMHHGPIFDLFNICAIVTDHLLQEGESVNSFQVADLVLKEHEKHNIQLVMLCETAHEAAENGSIFLHYNQGFGHLERFLSKYRKGIRRDQYGIVKHYLELSRKHNATDNGLFEIVKRVKKYVKD